MRSRVATVLFAALLCPSLLAQQRPDRRPQPPVELQNFTFQDRSFHSDAVDKEASFGIYLPKGYDDEANKQKSWPLVIWLHGLFEDRMRFHNRGGAPVLDKAVGDGVLPPCLFVLAEVNPTSMYVNRDKQRWEDLIKQDLVDHVFANYRVDQDHKHWALMGISLGGMAALRITLTQPELFGTVAVHSSAVFPDDPDKLPEGLKKMASRFGLDEVFGNPIDKDKWQAANPLCIAEHLDSKKIKGLRIYFDAGTNDRHNFGPANKLLDEALTAKHIEHSWELVEGGGHAWGSGFKEESLLKSLTFVGQAFGSGAATKSKETGKDKPASGKGDAKEQAGGKQGGSGKD